MSPSEKPGKADPEQPEQPEKKDKSAEPATAAEAPVATRNRFADFVPTVVDTVLAIVLALLIGAVLIIFSTPSVVETLSYFFSYPWDFFNHASWAIYDGYKALITGSVGSGGALRSTLERAAPLICAGLGVSLAFRAGMFNIGAQGQMFLGGLIGGYIGFHYDMPAGVHLLVAFAGALVAGAAWGAISGLLKARTGAHEVITTIMLNYTAGFVMTYFLAKETFQRPNSDNLLSPPVNDTALFPTVLGVHSGVLIAVLAGLGIWWLLDRSKLGFEMKAVGANPDAARTAGMSVAKVYVVAMAIAGLLAGMAASMQVLGHHDPLTDQLPGTIGFDAITVALLGRATPLGTVLAGLLFGALSAGGLAMQAAAGVPPDIAQVLQALIVLFVAAPALIRGLLRMKARRNETMMATGW